MRNLLKTLAISVIVSIATAGASFAQCHLGLQAGTSIASVPISTVGASLDGLGARSRTPDFGLHTGCDVKVSNSPFVVGLWGEYVWKDTQFSVAFGGPAFTASLGDAWSIGGRAGYMVGKVMPYGLLGYTTSDVKYSTPIAGTPTTLRGWTTGAGIEMPLAPNLTLALETRYTKFAETDLIPGLATVRADQISGVFRLNFAFGGDVIPAALTQPLK